MKKHEIRLNSPECDRCDRRDKSVDRVAEFRIRRPSYGWIIETEFSSSNRTIFYVAQTVQSAPCLILIHIFRVPGWHGRPAREITRKMRVPLSSHWLQALAKAPRIQRVLIIKSVSGEPSSFGPAAESPEHCRFLIADCRFDHLLENSAIDRHSEICQSAISGDPLNLIRLRPSKGETVIATVPSFFDGAVFCFFGVR